MNTIDRFEELVRARDEYPKTFLNRIGISYDTYKKRKSKKQDLKVEDIRIICKELDITISEFFDFNEDTDDEPFELFTHEQTIALRNRYKKN